MFSVHSIIIHNNQKLKPIQIATNEQMYNHKVMCVFETLIKLCVTLSEIRY